MSLGAPSDAELCRAAARKAAEAARVQQELVEAHGPAIAACARAVAGALREGGRIFAMGNGGSACDAEHLAVEFMHPIVEKRAAHAAYALSSDAALLTAIGNDRDFSMAYASQLRLLARRGDVAIGISTSGESANVVRGLQAAREIGMLTVGLSGRDGGRVASLCAHSLVVPSFSIHRVQEGHVLLLHLLWDLVHLVLGEEDVL